MSAVDVALTAAGFFFIIRGMMKGISGEVISLLGTVGGFFCSIKFHEPFAVILTTNFGVPAAPATILSMLAVFFAIFFGCAVVETLVKKIVKKTSLTVTDKTLGALEGLFKTYAAALLVLVGGFAIQPLAGDEWIRKSRVLSAVSITWPVASDLLDRAGLLPDINAIREGAREYIIRQAGRAVRVASGDVTMPPFDGFTNPDEAEPGAEM
ncbi:MAG: CvpA family protein [Synergistaceae bacterium]|jgi:uncharacterized membrane protein required for colicin V production|nr:CvpA family protein [Synergistaceae bacterium]